MLQGEHSATLSTFIKLPIVIKIFVASIFDWSLKTGFTVINCSVHHSPRHITEEEKDRKWKEREKRREEAKLRREQRKLERESRQKGTG